MKNEDVIIVLAGWLGAKKKALKVYKSLYQSLGFNCIIMKVAPPLAVFDAINSCTRYVDRNEANDVDVNGMIHLAKEIYDEIYRLSLNLLNLQTQHFTKSNNEKCVQIIWHSFSNGGCFLLEQFYVLCQTINKEKKSKDFDQFRKPYIEIKFKAMIFDSSPCFYSDLRKLHHAAQNNIFGDNNEEIQKILERIETDENEKKEQKQKIQARAHKFWENMQRFDYSLNSNENVPEFYIYATGDPLAPAKELKNLIRYRLQTRQHNQQNFERHIMMLEFSKSIHCDHLRCHQKEYTNALKCFLEEQNIKRSISGTEKDKKVNAEKRPHLNFKSNL